MKKLCCILAIYLSLTTIAQEKGIQFEEGLTWEQVKTKAKKENKYIFIDAYTTWCGPCKQMDKNVYANDTVGNYFNDRFVSIKVQMDKTDKDKEYVKSWYTTAEIMTKEYRVLGYPTYIFLSPAGTVVSQEMGYKSVDQFIELAQSATLPSKVYNNPYREYDSLLVLFKEGKINYGRIPYMIETALQLDDTAIAKTLANAHSEHLKGLKQDELYTKENIGFIAKYYISSSKSKFLRLFYPDVRKANAAMGEPGFAQRVVDKLIQKEMVEPITKIYGGMGQTGAKVPSAPDWATIYNSIREKYNKDYADRNVLQSKITWYRYYRLWSVWANYYIEKVDKYGVDTTAGADVMYMNDGAWAIFNEIDNPKQNQWAIRRMEQVIKRATHFGPVWSAMVTDTYANLLYKAGRKTEAIQWQQKALNIVINSDNEWLKSTIKSYETTLDKMKNGKPTWKAGSTMF